MLEINFNISYTSELHKQTLLKSKYNPHRLLMQYQKLYNNYLKQFNKLPDKEKSRIKEFCKSKGLNFIPSKDDITTKINSRIEEKMIEYSVGLKREDGEKLYGSHSLTTYMDVGKIANIKYRIKQKEENFYKPRIVGDYEIEEEWKKENEIREKKRNENFKNLQYNYSEAIHLKEKTDRPLTEICREVLHEEPMFEEPKKEKESQALIEQDKVKGFSFKTIKAAIAKAFDRGER